MSKLSVQTDHTNYLAKVVKLTAPRKHENADKLQVVTIDAQNVITGLDAKEGAVYIYFPLESVLNSDYLSYTNSFAKAELNRDTTAKGFFPSAGRVKTTKLRGLFSEGYIVPVKSLVEWLNHAGQKASEADFEVGTEFSHFNDVKICDKYINYDALRKLQNIERAKKNHGKVKRESKLIDNQFRLHIDTAPLKKYIQNIYPDDTISISEKIHGTSGVFGKVLCKKPLKWYEKILKKLGVNILDSHYDYVYSSRKVIKNAYADKKSDSYYDTDIWAIVANQLNPFLKDGMTFYVEIFGQLPNGKWIQKNYDYGTEPNKHDYAIYRITSTNASGDVIEFTEEQIISYCKKYGLKHVPFHYLGKASHFQPYLGRNDENQAAALDVWREQFLNELIKLFTEMDCPMSKNKVPREGVVIRRFNDHADVYKLKSLRFIQREAEEAEAGEVDVETQESVTQPTE